jgi:hypothetical protein
MRESAPVFNATQKQRVAVLKAYNSGIENTVDRVWPVLSRENRVKGVAGEKRAVGACFLRSPV